MSTRHGSPRVHATALEPPPHALPTPNPKVDLLLLQAVHDALRRDLRRLVSWSRTCFPVTTPAWIDFHRRLTVYLEADAAVLGPVLLRAGLGPTRDATARERTRVHITSLAQAVDDSLSGRGPASRTNEHMTRLATALTEHLRHQQSFALPILACHITASEWADFDAAQRHPLDIANGVALCAWLTDGATPDRRRAIRGLFPPAVRLAHRWYEARRRHRDRRRPP